MLTKDLLRLRRQGTEIRPQYLKSDGKESAFVAELVALFQNAIGQPQGEVRAQALELASAKGITPLLARGLLKVCLDAATTEEKADRNYAALRKSIFLAAAKRLAKPSHLPTCAEEVLPTLQQQVSQDLLQAENPGAAAYLAEGSLYADLPDESPLTSFPFEDAASVVLKYNISLAQSLLVNANQVVLTLERQDRALLRRLWKALRFHGLMARFKESSAPTETQTQPLEIEIEGPLSLHAHSMKYGFSLAAFLPSLLAEKAWRLEAQVSLDRMEKSIFRLEPRPDLTVKKRAFHQYTPPELALLQRSLATKAEELGWQVCESDDFVNLPGEVACFPDFLLVNPSGRKVHLEVFHPWHVAALRARAEQLKRFPHTPLVLAVSKKTAKATDADVLESLEHRAPGHVVLYRETPLAGSLFDAAAKLVLVGNA